MTRDEALTQITEIEAILNSGESTVTVGDRTITYDLPHLRRRLAQLYSYVRGGGNLRVGRYNRTFTP